MNKSKNLSAKATIGGITAFLVIGLPLLMATRVLGLSAGVAANLYYVVQAASWGGLALAIVGGLGIAGAAAAGVVAMIRRLALKEFVSW